MRYNIAIPPPPTHKLLMGMNLFDLPKIRDNCYHNYGMFLILSFTSGGDGVLEKEDSVDHPNRVNS
jgi:hypothetical protein